MTTTLQTYGFDSYPYLHVARRRCLPYARVLSYVDILDRAWETRSLTWMFDEADMLDEIDMEAIFVAWREEMKRRYPLAGIIDLMTPLVASQVIGQVSQ